MKAGWRVERACFSALGRAMGFTRCPRRGKGARPSRGWTVVRILDLERAAGPDSDRGPSSFEVLLGRDDSVMSKATST